MTDNAHVSLQECLLQQVLFANRLQLPHLWVGPRVHDKDLLLLVTDRADVGEVTRAGLFLLSMDLLSYAIAACRTFSEMGRVLGLSPRGQTLSADLRLTCFPCCLSLSFTGISHRKPAYQLPAGHLLLRCSYAFQKKARPLFLRMGGQNLDYVHTWIPFPSFPIYFISDFDVE